MASGFKGAKSFRRLLRTMPAAMRSEMVEVLTSGGRQIYAAIQARTPNRTGRLRRAVTLKIYPRSLRMRVGLIGVRANSKAFYGRILEFGRKAQVVPVSRRRVARSTLVDGRRVAHKPYLLKVKRLAPRQFVYGRLTDLRVAFGKQLRGVWDRALRRVGGQGND